MKQLRVLQQRESALDAIGAAVLPFSLEQTTESEVNAMPETPPEKAPPSVRTRTRFKFNGPVFFYNPGKAPLVMGGLAFIGGCLTSLGALGGDAIFGSLGSTAILGGIIMAGFGAVLQAIAETANGLAKHTTRL